MDGNQEQLTVGEFQRSIATLHSRFDGLEEGQRHQNERIAVLEDREAKTHKRTVSWSAAGAALVAVLFEGAARFLGAKP